MDLLYNPLREPFSEGGLAREPHDYLRSIMLFALKMVLCWRTGGFFVARGVSFSVDYCTGWSCLRDLA